MRVSPCRRSARFCRQTRIVGSARTGPLGRGRQPPSLDSSLPGNPCRLRKSGSQIHLQNLKAIAHGSLSSKDWLDTDIPERRKALQQLFQQQTAQVDYEEADAAFLNAEIDANDSLIDATIGWAIDEACRDKSAPIRGSKEWLELVRALARAQADAIERVLERDLGNFGRSSQLLDATVPGKSVGSAVSLETLLEMYLTGLARAGHGLAMKKRAD